VDQLERSRAVSAAWVTEVRGALAEARAESGNDRTEILTGLATTVEAQADGSRDPARVRMLAEAVRGLAGM